MGVNSFVLGRTLTIVAVALSVGACAGQPSLSTNELQNTTLSSTDVAGMSEAEAEAKLLRKKTLAGQVLAALALERVTGKKPAAAF